MPHHPRGKQGHHLALGRCQVSLATCRWHPGLITQVAPAQAQVHCHRLCQHSSFVTLSSLPLPIHPPSSLDALSTQQHHAKRLLGLQPTLSNTQHTCADRHARYHLSQAIITNFGSDRHALCLLPILSRTHHCCKCLRAQSLLLLVCCLASTACVTATASHKGPSLLDGSSICLRRSCTWPPLLSCAHHERLQGMDALCLLPLLVSTVIIDACLASTAPAVALS